MTRKVIILTGALLILAVNALFMAVVVVLGVWNDFRKGRKR
jgi:hypothetical protein